MPCPPQTATSERMHQLTEQSAASPSCQQLVSYISTFVHRDIRLDNIVKGPKDWVLLDWELAGRQNQSLWWTGQVLPPAVKSGSETYTCKTDLWQIGQLMLTCAISSAGSAAYAHQLMSGHVMSAALAPAAEWND